MPNGRSWANPCPVSNDQRGAPLTPCLVKIWMTPAAASVPYSVLAAEPLMISTWSMSAGLMSFSGLAW